MNDEWVVDDVDGGWLIVYSVDYFIEFSLLFECNEVFLLKFKYSVARNEMNLLGFKKIIQWQGAGHQHNFYLNLFKFF